MQILHQVRLATGRAAGKGLVDADVRDARLAVDVVAAGT
jgi:hypothetical protein